MALWLFVSLVGGLVECLLASLLGWFVGFLVVSFFLWFVVWLVDCLIPWLVDGWLVGSLLSCLLAYLLACLLACFLPSFLVWLVGWLVGWFYATLLHSAPTKFQKRLVHASTSFVQLCTLCIHLKRVNSVSTCVQRPSTATRTLILTHFFSHILELNYLSLNQFRCLNFVFPIIKK